MGGSVGISLAQSIPDCDVVLTDLPEVTELVEANIERMNPAINSRVRFEPLDWETPLPGRAGQRLCRLGEGCRTACLSRERAQIESQSARAERGVGDQGEWAFKAAVAVGTAAEESLKRAIHFGGELHAQNALYRIHMKVGVFDACGPSRLELGNT